MINIFTVVLTLFLSGTSVNLSDFLVISHRGLPSEAPAHTFMGYDLAIEQGSNYIEQDLILSKDGHLIVSHDDKIAKGKYISKMTLEEIKEIKTANDEHFYTLNEIFERYGKTVNYVIENKMTDDDYQTEKAMIRVIHKYGLKNNVVFQSFNKESLMYFSEHEPSIPRMILVRERKNADFLKHYEDFDYVDVVAIESKLLNEEKTTELRDAGFKVFAYFVSEPKKEAKRVIELGLDGIFTDYTGRTFGLLKEREGEN